MTDKTENKLWSEITLKIRSSDHKTRLAGLTTVKDHFYDKSWKKQNINSIPHAILIEILQCIKNYIDDKTWQVCCDDCFSFMSFMTHYKQLNRIFSDYEIRDLCSLIFYFISRTSQEYAQAIIDSEAVSCLVKSMYHDDKYEENTAINNVILTFQNMCKHDNGFEMFNVLYDAGVIDGFVMILIRADPRPRTRDYLCDMVEVSCELPKYCKDYERIKPLVEAIIEFAGKCEDFIIDSTVCDFIKDIFVRFFDFVDARLACEMLAIVRKTLQDEDDVELCAGIDAIFEIVFLKYDDPHKPRLTNLEWLRWAFQTELLASVVTLMNHNDEHIADRAFRIVKLFTVRLGIYLFLDICYHGSNLMKEQ